jgi:hypothetical protein
MVALAALMTIPIKALVFSPTTRAQLYNIFSFVSLNSTRSEWPAGFAARGTGSQCNGITRYLDLLQGLYVV